VTAAILTALLTAVAAGLVVAVVLLRGQRETARQLTEQLRAESTSQREAGVQAAIDAVVSIANERLGAHAQLQSGDLDAKKGLIDQQLAGMKTELEKVTGLVKDLESGRQRQYGELATQIKQASMQTAELGDMTRSLREALSSTSSRGQWGERMAEDVLTLAGFIEGVNYHRQRQTDSGSRPDFTFPLPQGMCLHMDVKFPLSNYLRFLEADSDTDRERHRKEFLRDARNRVKELATRDYIDPDETVDCVLLFIPNEQLYGFLQLEDPELLDTALRSKVVLCSPLTLFAVLAVVRQSADNFRLERTSDEILTHLGTFNHQWGKFTEQLETVGKRIQTAYNGWEELNGPRRRQLEKPLDKLEGLRQDRELPVAGEDGEVLRLATGS
jgi:DNA recombination protein RmuC